MMFKKYTLTVRGTQALVSFAPLAFKLFFAARQNAVLRRFERSEDLEENGDLKKKSPSIRVVRIRTWD